MKFSVDERVLRAIKRETKHEEDMVYSLLGICNVFLSLIYEEGRENAFRRLREEVNRGVKVMSSISFRNPVLRTTQSSQYPLFAPKFVSREDIMQEITNRLEIQRRIALCGIGGIG